MEDLWDPMVHDFEDPGFNTYDKGPAKGLGPASEHHHDNAKRNLYVGGIPRTLSHEGLLNIFSRCGKVTRADIKQPREKEARTTFGFVMFENYSDAVDAIAKFNKFEIEKGKYRLQVKVAMTQEESRKRYLERKMDGFNDVRDESDSDSDPGDPFVKTKPTPGEEQRTPVLSHVSLPLGRGKPVSPASIPVGRGKPESQQTPTPAAPGKPKTAPAQAASPSPSEMSSRKEAADMSGYGSDTSVVSMKPAAVGTCVRCHRPAKHRCRRCQSYYCSADCQKMDWKEGHKIKCKQIIAEQEAAKAKPAQKNHELEIDMKKFEEEFEVSVGENAVASMLEESGLPKEAIAGVIRKTPAAEPPVPVKPSQPKPQGHKRLKIGDLGSVKLAKNIKVEINIQDISSPDHICITLASSAQEILQLGEKLKEMYSGSSNLGADSYTPERDEVVAAQYPDGSWYRAHVKAINLDGLATVYFVDYGNMEDLPVVQLRRLRDNLGVLPAQAMRCQLDVIPKPGTTWDVEALTCLAHLGCGDPTQKFWCSAVSKKDALYTVNLINCTDGSDLCEALISKDLALRRPSAMSTGLSPPLSTAAAAPTHSSPAQLPCKPVKASTPHSQAAATASPLEAPPVADGKGPSRLALPPIFAPSIPTAQKYLRADSVIKLKVLEQITPSQFYVHILDPGQLSQLSSQQEMMNAHYEKLPPKKGFKPNVNKLYACKFMHDGSWYRAYVYDYNAQFASVQYMDYGNHELVPFANLHSLESPFCQLPFQAVNCRLDGVTGTEKGGSWSRASTLFFGKQVENQELRAKVTKVEPEQIVVKVKLPNGHMLSNLMVEAEVAVRSESTPTKSPAPQQSPPQVQQQQQQAASPPQMSATSLSPSPTASSPRVAQPSPIAAVSPKASPPMPVSPVMNGVAHTAPMACDLPVMPLPEDKHLFMVTVSDAETPSLLTVQLCEEEAVQQILTLAQELEKTYAAHTGGYRPTQNHSLVAAKFTDGCWYRGEVLSIGEKYKIRFVDYGNVDELGAEKLAELTPPFMKFPMFGLRCTLNGTGALCTGQVWDPKVIADKPYAMRVASRNADLLDVVLIDDSTHALNEILVKNGILLSRDAEEAKINQETSNFGAKATVSQIISHGALQSAVNDGVMVHFEVPGEFYVHLDIHKELLGDLMREINSSLLNSKGEYTPVKYEVVAVFYEEDSCWYRCQVLSVSGRRAKVHFTDFGNMTVVDIAKIRPLDPKYATMPAYAIKCSFGGVTDDTCRWSASAISKVDELLKDKILKFTFDINQRTVGNAQVVLEVMLAVDNAITKLSDYLITSKYATKEILMRLGESIEVASSQLQTQHLPPAKIDVSIQHVNAPNDFYLNILEDWCYTSLQNMLISLNQRVATEPGYAPTDVGEMVAAKFENAWYRAQVEGLQDDKFKVFFIDFGNTELVEMSGIRELPMEFLEQPAQAIHCELANLEPSPGAAWSKDACRYMASLLMKTMSLCPLAGAGDQKKHSIDLRMKESGSGQAGQGERVSDLLIQQGFAKRVEAPVVKSKMAANLSPSPVANHTSQNKTPPRASPSPVKSASASPRAAAAPNSMPQSSTPPRPPVFLRSQLGEAKMPETGQVMVSDAASLSAFSCQSLNNQIQAVMELIPQLKEYCESVPAVAGFNPQLGEMCCARYSEDGNWYRAAVTAVLEPGRKWTVVMVDWGSVDTVDAANIRPISHKYMALPAQAIKCALNGIHAETPDALATFKGLSADVLLTCTLVKMVGDTAHVSLESDTGVNINAQIQTQLPQARAALSLEEENRLLKERLAKMEEMMTQLMAAAEK